MRNILFIVLLSSLLFSVSCSESSNCNSHTSVPGVNGKLYAVSDANGVQQPAPVTAQNGNVAVPCGGSAAPAF